MASSDRLLHGLKAWTPALLRRWLRQPYYAGFRIVLLVRCWYADLLSGREARRAMPMPPALLRYRVSEDLDPHLCLNVGERTCQDMQAALLEAGRRLTDFHSILDFGCGCGRTLMWLTRQLRGADLHGADVDPDAVAWCVAHLPGAHFQANAALPPLDYPAETFDLIYAISVFTHLHADGQKQWLAELARLLRPGGILLLTVYGERVRRGWDQNRLRRLEREGFLFETSRKLRGIVPDWYHTAHHTREYAVSLVAGHFRVLRYLPGGMGYQDVLIAELPAPGA